MPILSASVQALGPVVNLAVQVSIPRLEALQAAGLAVPKSVVIRGLIDTGAYCTCIDPAVIQRLGIQPTGIASIITPSTGTAPHQCKQFDVSLGVLLGTDIHVIETLPVIEASLSHQGHEALIGRDVLSRALLIFDGKGGRVTLAF